MGIVFGGRQELYARYLMACRPDDFGVGPPESNELGKETGEELASKQERVSNVRSDPIVNRQDMSGFQKKRVERPVE
jgi:hypothetical protein